MKRTFEDYVILALCVATLLFVAVFGSIAIITNDAPSTDYAMTCKVVEIDHEKDLVTVVDSNGFEWTWEGVEDWQIGDCASLLMNDSGTDEIFDDVILSMRFNGWGLN